MTKQTALEAARRAIAGRVFGPFRESGGLPGEQGNRRMDSAARAYQWNRRVRGMGASDALRVAAPVALCPHTDKGARLWYGNRGSVGGTFRDGSDILRWFESTADVGLRFVGWADELDGGPSHSGWYCSEENMNGDTLRGGVWQLPGLKGQARLVYGYAEHEGRGEMNPGSVAIVVSHIVLGERDDGISLPGEAVRDAARWADGIAESVAEERRDYDSAYQVGREAAEADAEVLEAHAELLPLMGELRALRRSDVAAETPKACQALRRTVDSLLETISEKRAERDKLWGDCGSYALEAFKAGFMDNASGGFVRAVRLGYARATDWRGAADANPCNVGAGA